MNALPLTDVLRTERETLAARWCDRLRKQRVAKGSRSIDFGAELASDLMDEITQLLTSSRSRKIPRIHRSDVFLRFGEFPENVSICVEIFEVGLQALGAFVVENSGAQSAWNRSTRNRYLGELDAVFHVLVHREIQALCEFCLHHDVSSSSHPDEACPDSEAAVVKPKTRAILRN